MPYDVYLQNVCRAQPVLEDLLVTIPALGTPALQKKLIPHPIPPEGVYQRDPPRPGFLGLDVEEGQAREVFRRLVAVGVHGEVLPTSYRDRKMLVERVKEIAEQELRRKCQESYPTLQFGLVRLLQEEPRFWVFLTVSKELQKQGLIPGGLMAYIDKVDGHVWSKEEIETWGEEEVK